MIDKLTPRQFKSDQDERLTDSVTYTDALNVTVDTDANGNAGVVKTPKGNRRITNSTGITYDNTTWEVLGSVRDPERGRTYMFIQSPQDDDGEYPLDPQGQDAIVYYDDAEDEIVLVLKGSWLNFNANYAISANVINGYFRDSGDLNTLLYFTDDYNEPRKVNVDHASEVTNQTGNAQKRRMIEVMKPAPFYPITASSGYDEALGVADFTGKSAFQFAYQYIYDDGEVSALSPISRSYLSGRLPSGNYPNFMRLTMNHVAWLDGNPGVLEPTARPFLESNVKFIRVLYREEEGLEQSPFRILDELDPSKALIRTINDINEYEISPVGAGSYVFLNRGYTSTLPSQQEDLPFQAVPRRAKAQSIINSRLVYGNYTEGFNNVDSPNGIEGYSGDALDGFSISATYTDTSDTEYDTYPMYSSGITTSTEITTSGDPWIDVDVSGMPTTFLNGDYIYLDWKGDATVRVEGSVGTPSIDGVYINVGDFTGNAYEMEVYDDIEIVVSDEDNPWSESIQITQQLSRTNVIDTINEYFEDHPKTFRTTHTNVSTNTFISSEGSEDWVGADVEIQTKVKIVFQEGATSDQWQFRFVPYDQGVTKITWSEFPLAIVLSGQSGGPINPVNQQADFSTNAWDEDDGAGLNSLHVHTVTSLNADEYYRSLKVAGGEPVMGFTAGSNHSFAIAYVDDKGRFGNAQEIGSVYVAPIGHADRYFSGSWHNGPATITVDPGTTRPPDWAVGYNLLYAGPDDIEYSMDLFIDDATKVIKKTKFFPIIPDSVFVNIKTFVDRMRNDGLEFNAMYSVKEGDILRIVSRRGSTANADYTAGDGTSGSDHPSDNPHTVEDGTEFYSEFTAAEGYDGTNTIDFRVKSILEISADTDPADYPFTLDSDGSIIPGTFIELQVDPLKAGWGKEYIMTLGEFSGRDNNALIDSGGLTFPYNRPAWATYVSEKLALSPDDTGYVPLFSGSVHREEYTDIAIGSGATKYLQTPLLQWDKGIRAQLIQRKQRTSGKVYHEIGEFHNFSSDRFTYADAPHGDPFTTSNGYAIARKGFFYNPPSFGDAPTTAPVLYGAYFEAGPGTQQTEFEFDGSPNSVKPQNYQDNFFLEAFEAYYGGRLKANSIGRFNVVSRTAKEELRRYSLIHSGFQGSETLNLALQDFEASNFKDLDVNNGPINAIVDSGEFITVLQNSKVSKVPISRSILATAGGDNNLIASNTVFGPERSFNGDYGVDTDINAVIDVDKTIYFIDKGRQAIIKISGDGFMPISDGPISREIEKTFQTYKNINHGYSLGYDKDYGHLYVTWNVGTGGKTYGFDHRKGLWVSRYSFAPNAYFETENDMGAVGGANDLSIWFRHDADSFPGRFFNNYYDTTLSLVSTGKNPSMVKTFNAIGVESNRSVNVTVNSSGNSYNVVMDDSYFNEKEESYFAEIFADGANIQNTISWLDNTGADYEFSGHIVPLGPLDSVESDRFVLKNKVNIPIPTNQNCCLIFWNGTPVSNWNSILRAYFKAGNPLAGFGTGFIDATNITETGVSGGKTYLKADGFFGTYDADLATYPITEGTMMAYVVAKPSDVGDGGFSGTIINQPYGGKKVRGHYAEIDVVYDRTDGKDFELYAIDVDFDESKLHM